MKKTGKKILIVDDDKFLLDIYSLKFNEGGYDVDVAFSGAEALEKIKKEKPDILLLDIVMPEMDGLELLKKMHEEGLNKDIKCVVLSNQSQQSDMDTADEYGACGYIVKASSTPSEVLSKVKKITD
jgi:two-component system, OmpR family, alkaline phosphatase synthesis response regulator PhoP